VKDQLVIRTAFAETPPRVEYCLSPKGKELVPILKAIAKWGNYLVEI
jgi:DNA-binding HxlR family transcriptional regulator